MAGHQPTPGPIGDGAKGRDCSRVSSGPLKLFLVAGEHSGDVLGGKLMEALRRNAGCDIEFSGVGGEMMEAEGLASIFPLSDVAVMGPVEILKRLPKLIRRVYSTVDAALAAEPDIVVIIDSPEFTHPIAKRIRKGRPDIAIIDYVSPTVWAWRPGRAKKMAPYVDHLLALLPFEPDAHKRLGGPRCSYVGHPLIERVAWVDGLKPERLAARLGIEKGRPVLVVLPGSRSSEVAKLMAPFGDTVRRLLPDFPDLEIIVPAVPSVRALIEEGLEAWPRRPHLISGDDDKFTAFRLADAALAASGTVSLELGLAGTPMLVSYRVDGIAKYLQFLVKVPSFVLANLVIGRNAFAEYIQDDCDPAKMAPALSELLHDTPARRAQLEALSDVRKALDVGDQTPSEAAARIVLSYRPRELAAPTRNSQ